MHACMRMNWAYLPTLISPTKNQLESCICLYFSRRNESRQNKANPCVHECGREKKKGRES